MLAAWGASDPPDVDNKSSRDSEVLVRLIRLALMVFDQVGGPSADIRRCLEMVVPS